MLHNIDEQREIAAVITNRPKMQMKFYKISREDRVNTVDSIAVSLFGWSKQIQYKISPNIRRQDPNNYSDTEMRALSKYR